MENVDNFTNQANISSSGFVDHGDDIKVDLWLRFVANKLHLVVLRAFS